MAKNKKKNPLLKEGTFRRFGTLAGVAPLTGPLHERFYKEEQEPVEENTDTEALDENSEEDVNEVKTKGEARVGGGTDRLDEMPMPPGEEEELPPEVGGMDDMDDELPPEDDMGGGGMEGEVEELVAAIADAITSTTGVDVDVAGTGGELPPEDDMGGELPPEDDMGDEYEDDEEMMETDAYMLERGYMKGKGGYKKYDERQLAERGVFKEGDKFQKFEGKELDERKEAFDEAQKLDEDAYQEGKRGKPTPGTAEKVEGADKGSKIPTGGDPATGSEKAAPKPKLDEVLTKRVLQRLLKEIKASRLTLTKDEQKAALAEALKAKKSASRKGKKKSNN